MSAIKASSIRVVWRHDNGKSSKGSKKTKKMCSNANGTFHITFVGATLLGSCIARIGLLICPPSFFAPLGQHNHGND